jgi:hypothetical protein
VPVDQKYGVSRGMLTGVARMAVIFNPLGLGHRPGAVNFLPRPLNESKPWEYSEAAGDLFARHFHKCPVNLVAGVAIGGRNFKPAVGNAVVNHQQFPRADFSHVGIARAHSRK